MIARRARISRLSIEDEKDESPPRYPIVRESVPDVHLVGNLDPGTVNRDHRVRDRTRRPGDDRSANLAANPLGFIGGASGDALADRDLWSGSPSFQTVMLR